MAFTVTAKAIVPKGFDTRKLRVEVGKALRDEGKRDQKELAKTTDGWRSAPPIKYLVGITLQSAWVWIGPAGTEELIKKWRRIDEGTGPRGWTSAGMMVFPFQGRGKSYIPKTRPLWIGSSAGGGQKLGPVTRTRTIQNHRIEPRYWSKTLAARRIGPFAHNVQAAINRGLA